MLVSQSCPTLCDPMDSSPLSVRFSRQGYWSGLPFPSPGDLPDPGIEPGSPALQADSLPTELQGKPNCGLNELENLAKSRYLADNGANILGRRHPQNHGDFFFMRYAYIYKLCVYTYI